MSKEADMPLIDQEDHEVISMREAHFGGSFEQMRKFYASQDEDFVFDPLARRITELEDLEQKIAMNLAESLLDHEHDQIVQVKERYAQLEETQKSKSATPCDQLIASLVLSHGDGREAVIQKIIALGEEAVEPLIELINDKDMHNALFPGFGDAPSYAAFCLGMIKDARAIIPLFELVGASQPHVEEEAMIALRKIGDKALETLLSRLEGPQLHSDTRRAAICLIHFNQDERVGDAALKKLLQGAVLKDIESSLYLVLCCEFLKDPKKREAFLAFSKDERVSEEVRSETKIISDSWK